MIMGDAKVAGIVVMVWMTAGITRMRRDVNVRTLRFFAVEATYINQCDLLIGAELGLLLPEC